MSGPSENEKNGQSTSLKSPSERHRTAALHYATLIQHRKDVEAQNLDGLERLIELPSSDAGDAADPSQKDVLEGATLLKLFQTSDFDALVEERNINRKCGYFLCGNANKLQDTRAKFRLLRAAVSNKDKPSIVETRALEKWCSDECASRAQFVRVQLSSEPAWTRDAGNLQGIIVPRGPLVMPERNAMDATPSDDTLMSSDDPSLAKAHVLALERGRNVVTDDPASLINVRERGVGGIEALSHQFGQLETHDTIEGYRPNTLGSQNQDASVEIQMSKDILETI